MKLTERIRHLIEATARDIFGEDGAEIRRAVDGETTAERLAGLLDEAQRQLDSLRLELGNAVSHQKRIAQVWQSAAGQVKTLEAAVDAAVQAGQDEKAREYLAQLKPAREHASELDALNQACEQRSEDVRQAVAQQQEKLDALRQRTLALTDRERSVEALDALLGDQLSLARQSEKLHHDLSVWEEQIARREDRLAARQEWSKQNGPDR